MGSRDMKRRYDKRGHISVIVTSYNQREYLREAIESVLAQTLSPFEIIVCDDASTDGSRELIKEYETRYRGLVKGIYHEKNVKISRNRTSGVKAAQGDLVTWLDGDDRYKPRKLEMESAALLNNREAKWAYSQVDIIDEHGNKKGVRYSNPPDGFILETLVSMLGHAPRNQLIYRKCIEKIGLFREDMALYEDFDFCLRLAKHYKAVYCPEPLVEYRIHSGGLHALNKQLHFEHFIKLYSNLGKLISQYPQRQREELATKFRDRINTVAGQVILPREEKRTLLGRVMNIFTK
jgi:glycosyltransferase involved in cell wall biosynthesis